MRNYSTRKRILVTGGAGFLGSHLCERLLADGHDVLCADNFFTGTKDNIVHLVGQPHFELMRHDVTFPLYVEVDEIYNLACPASPVHYQYDPVQTTKTSVHGAINMLGLAKRVKAKILQASTSEVYGDPQVHPQTEDYWGNVNPIGTRSCYDEGKRCAETLFFDYHRQYKLSIKVARIFNTYGPRMHPNDGRVVSNFIVQALKGEPITIYGEGKQTRSFCYVDDLIDGLVRLMDSADDFTGPVNLGNPGEFTILELAKKVVALTRSNSQIEFKPLPSDDPTQRKPDIGLAKRILGWTPHIALDEGLPRAIAYFRDPNGGALKRMCGIAGIYAYRESAPPVDEQELLRIREAMIHRGPDGAGLWISPDRKVGLAHRRLAIIDLSDAGAQPMATADGIFRITFNGEIYNYRELRKELEAKGYRFHSNSDTEVLLHLYADRGADMVHALRGMYAFGIWDERKKGMFLARDPFGIKPLYYADDGRTLRFASQVKALLRGGAIGNDAEPAGHAGFFVWGSVPEPFTLYKAIRAVPAGAKSWVDGNGLRGPTAFFSIAEEFAKAREQDPGESDGSRAERALAALRDSVRHHMIADVPVGAFLSAGLDSATIMALASEDSSVNLRTLTLGFKEYLGTPNDETDLAAIASARYGARHETRWITRRDFETELPRILEAMDQPSIDGVNTYFVSKAAADAGMKVAISGLGGDELFGGYPSFRDVPRMRRAASVFSGIPKFGKALRSALSPLAQQFTSPKYAGILEYGGSYGGAYLLRRAVFMPWELPELMDPELAARGWEELQPLSQLEGTTRGLSKEQQIVSALELSWYMRNQLLRDSDWAGMAHSLEIRVPYLDISFFRGLAPLISGKGALHKADLARALKPPLPDQIINRAKTGFTVPVREWCIDMFGKQAEARGIRGWARHVMLHTAPAAVGTSAIADGRSPFYVLSPQGASARRATNTRRSETQAQNEASAAATPNLSAASDVPQHTVLVTIVHRSQAVLIAALYNCVNALLYATALLLWPRRRPVSAERVCVFRIGYIGDIVCALPAIRSVRRAYPNAHLTLFTSPGPAGPGAAELLPGNDWIDEIRVYYSEDIQFMSGRLKLLRELRTRRFDAWIEIPNNLSSISRQFRDMLFTWTVGVRWARGWRINTIRLAAQAQSEHLHFNDEVDRTLDIVRRSGIPVIRIDYGLPRLHAPQARIDELLRTQGLQNKVLVAIAPGAKRSTNRWPADRFAEVGRFLVDSNYAIVLVAGVTEAELCRRLASEIGTHAHSFAGKLSLPESIELLRRCRLLIGVDSGVQHLASALGTPCVSLFSAREIYGKWHPHGSGNVVLQKRVPCHTCLLDACPHGNQCMKAIEVGEVLLHITEKLQTDKVDAASAIPTRPARLSAETAANRSSI